MKVVDPIRQRFVGLKNSGWTKSHPHGHICSRKDDGVLPTVDVELLDIGNLSTKLSFRADDRYAHFRDLYIHKHLDDPTIETLYFKDVYLPSWWWIVSNKESD